MHGGEVVAVDHRVEVLAADHPERRLGELARDRRRLVARGEPDRLREQRVAGEDADALPELLPRRGVAAPLLVVVHRRQVVVDERERVDELDRERRRHHLLDRRAESLADRERDHRSHALAADLERVAHGRRLAVQLRPELEPLELLVDERFQLVRTVHRPPPRAARASSSSSTAFASSDSSPSSSIARSGDAPSSVGELLELGTRSLDPLQQLLRPRQRFVGAQVVCSSRTSLPRIPFTSLAASSDAYRFASVTASSSTTSTGTSPSSSSSSATRRTFRSTAPSRSAVQSSEAA